MDWRGHLKTSIASLQGGVIGALGLGIAAMLLSLRFQQDQENFEAIGWALYGAIVGAVLGAGGVVFTTLKATGTSRPLATALLVAVFVAAGAAAAIAVSKAVTIGPPVLLLMFPTAPVIARAVANALPGGQQPPNQ